MVITGAGRAFCAGVDLRRVVESDPGYVEQLVTGLRRTLETLFCFPKPTVAAVNGAAVAGGCILACACDRRLMADDARIGASELAVGVPFPVAALEILRHACGSRTEDLVLRAGLLDAHEALTIGMVHEICPGNAVLERARAAAAELAGRAPLAFALAKEQLGDPRCTHARDRTVSTRRSWPSGPRRTPRRGLRAQLDRLAAGR